MQMFYTAEELMYKKKGRGQNSAFAFRQYHGILGYEKKFNTNIENKNDSILSSRNRENPVIQWSCVLTFRGAQMWMKGQGK